jgi:phosphatidylserine/phosphatidylglycerophosphate/cardiolipin synthase-like enzyme
LQVRLLIDNSWPAFSAKHRGDIEAYVASLASQPLAAHGIHVELAYFPGRGVGILHSKTIVRDSEEALVMTGNFKTAGGMRSDYYNMGVLASGPVARVLQDDWLNARHDSELKLSSGPAPAELGVDKDPWTGDANGIPAAMLSRRANAHLRNQGDNNPQDRALVAMIRTARKRITVLNPAVNIGAVMDAIVEAVAKHQVRVEMVLSLNMDRRNQSIFGGADNAESAYRLYKRILHDAGPGVADRLTIRWASSDGRTAAPDGDSGNVHAKAAGYDGNALWVGSMNWDWQSWNNSREVSVAFFGDGVAADFNARIFADRFGLAVPIKADDLPRVHRRKGNRVYQYLKDRQGVKGD